MPLPQRRITPTYATVATQTDNHEETQTESFVPALTTKHIALIVFVICDLDKNPSRSNRLKMVCDAVKIVFGMEVDPADIHKLLAELTSK